MKKLLTIIVIAFAVTAQADWMICDENSKCYEYQAGEDAFLPKTEAPAVVETPHEPYVVPYWSADAESDFTSAELYMMLSANNSCANKKHFKAVQNPSHVPVLHDHFANNNKVYDLYFPGCQYSTAKNFSMKTMAQPANQKQFPVGKDIWQAFSIFVPENYSQPRGWNVVYQYHAHPDDPGTCDNWRSPPLSFAMLDNGAEWGVNLRSASVKCQKSNSEGTHKLVSGQPIVKGGWTHFVIHTRFDWRGDGQAEVWIKDDRNSTPVKIVDYSGPLGYNDDQQPYNYVSFGYYYGTTAGPDVQLYFDRFIFSEAGSLEGLMYSESGS